MARGRKFSDLVHALRQAHLGIPTTPMRLPTVAADLMSTVGLDTPDRLSSVDKIYELTREVMAEQVTTEEKSVGESKRLYPGTVLRVVRDSHPWGGMQGIEYCTVKLDDRHYNILAKILEASIRPRASEPGELA